MRFEIKSVLIVLCIVVNSFAIDNEFRFQSKFEVDRAAFKREALGKGSNNEIPFSVTNW